MNVVNTYAYLQSDLQFVEQRLEEEMRSGQRELHEAAAHLLKAGGKRIRPVFVLLSGHFGTYDIDALARVAVILELVHMATLVHDDVIDHSSTRRGSPTVRAEWGNKMAMYTGDFIFAKAMVLLSQVEHPEVQRMLSESMVKMCEGEIEQIRDFYRIDQNIYTYFRRIKRKTALLMAVACAAGGVTSGCSTTQVRSLYRFGYHLGMAFQIVDDILDLTAEASVLGKPVGSDLRQGNLTAPVLYTLTCSPAKDTLVKLISPNATEEQIQEAIALVRSSGGIEWSQELARKFLKKSLSFLHELPANATRDSLEMIASFVADRDY